MVLLFSIHKTHRGVSELFDIKMRCARRYYCMSKLLIPWVTSGFHLYNTIDKNNESWFCNFNREFIISVAQSQRTLHRAADGAGQWSWQAAAAAAATTTTTIQFGWFTSTCWSFTSSQGSSINLRGSSYRCLRHRGCRANRSHIYTCSTYRVGARGPWWTKYWGSLRTLIVFWHTFQDLWVC